MIRRFSSELLIGWMWWERFNSSWTHHFGDQFNTHQLFELVQPDSLSLPRGPSSHLGPKNVCVMRLSSQACQAPELHLMVLWYAAPLCSSALPDFLLLRTHQPCAGCQSCIFWTPGQLHHSHRIEGSPCWSRLSADWRGYDRRGQVPQRLRLSFEFFRLIHTSVLLTCVSSANSPRPYTASKVCKGVSPRPGPLVLACSRDLVGRCKPAWSSRRSWCGRCRHWKSTWCWCFSVPQLRSRLSASERWRACWIIRTAGWIKWLQIRRTNVSMGAG